MKKTDPANYAYCDSPFACAAAPIISRKWVPVVVCHLLHGPKRYNELKRAIPHLSAKVLTQNLRELENEKILTRRVYKNSKASASFEAIYELTNKGKDLSNVIFAMNSWGKKWLGRESSNRQMLPIVNVE